MPSETVLLKNGEYAVKLKAKFPIKCKECGRQILVGQTFWLDFVPLRERLGRKTHWKKVVCEACWRGPKNIWKKK